MARGTTWEVVAADDKLLDTFLAEHSKCRIYEGRILQLIDTLSSPYVFSGDYGAVPTVIEAVNTVLAQLVYADRQAKGKITRDGVFIEKLETNPLQYIPEELRHRKDTNAVRIDTNRPMAEIRAELSKYPTTTRLLINGPIIVARDIAHAKLKEMLDAGKPLPDYFKNHPVYYAGPAKTPAGMPSGSFGPTTAGRMDSYVDLFQSHGGSMIMIAKGNRGQQVTDACKKHGGFYLGSIGGPAAILAKENIKKV